MTPTLGCGEPVAEIWTRGGATRVLALPDLVGGEWGRVLADTSQAKVEVSAGSDDAFVALLRTVKPWKHELHLFRDGVEEWCGPVTRMLSPEGSNDVSIEARDLSAWLDRRLVHQTHIYGGQGANQGAVDTTTVFSDLVTDALAPDTTPNLSLSFGDLSGVLAQGNYTPAAFKTVGPLIRDLAKGSIDWYVIRRVLTYSGGGANTPSTPAGGIDVTSTDVVNPGFETNTTGWSISGTGWGLTRDTGVKHSGTASGKATRTPESGTNPVPVTLSTSLSNLIVGKSYTVSVWLRAGVTIPHYLSGSRVTVSAAGVTSSDVSYALYAAPTTQLQVSLVFKATATTHTLAIKSLNTAGGAGGSLFSFYADDVQLILNNPDAPPPAPAASIVPDFYLNDDSLAAIPAVTLSGLDQENRSIVTGQATGGDAAFYGEAPDPQWTLDTTGPGLTADQTEFGLLETATSATLADASSASSQATQRNALLSATPVVLERVTLASTAPVTMSQLIPGAAIAIRLDRTSIPVDQVMLLREVRVTVSASGGEVVTLALEGNSAQ